MVLVCMYEECVEEVDGLFCCTFLSQSEEIERSFLGNLAHLPRPNPLQKIHPKIPRPHLQPPHHRTNPSLHHLPTPFHSRLNPIISIKPHPSPPPGYRTIQKNETTSVQVLRNHFLSTVPHETLGTV